VTAGKHGRQLLVAASNCNNSTSHPYVTNRLTKMSFLVETGNDFCIYPHSHLRERPTQTSYELFTANGTTVHIYGCITRRLDFDLRREFSWRFVTDIMEPIIGWDFLCFYNLLVDMRHQRLIDITNLTVNSASTGMYGVHIKVFAGSSRYHTLL